ncbi:hypothetical protein DYB30_006925 [Aphanomyces astaci]|uniref:Uncharacterized protein n=1 Tax=Aphanomyces astaci TaxID=112090 RepID=A0A397CTR9_APHAT|nr:hypothetical protein DYB30_006925 [Aphanomyces astaci]RHY54087.1 hypothetical protein DYB38_010872 [Aphanomyces astaci]RHY72737.1 hypothetical protein DYB34_013200 [Aphanomyces astaci]RHZ38359.1 hypothetical protein DYB26_010453 [Aphanomyces astaci]
MKHGRRSQLGDPEDVNKHGVRATSDIADVVILSKGEILAWDGFAQQVRQKTLKLGEFHLDKNIHGIAEEVAVGDLDGTLPPAINKTTAAFSANKAGTGLVKSKHCLLRTKDKNVMGGNPPKRSNMQSKLDPNSDFR